MENSYHQNSSPYYLIISFISCEKANLFFVSISLDISIERTQKPSQK